MSDFTFWDILRNLLTGLQWTLALSLVAFIGGGIVPRLGAHFDDALFRQQFEAKGRYAEFLAGVPVWAITASTPALIGASRALDVLP